MNQNRPLSWNNNPQRDLWFDLAKRRGQWSSLQENSAAFYVSVLRSIVPIQRIDEGKYAFIPGCTAPLTTINDVRRMWRHHPDAKVSIPDDEDPTGGYLSPVLYLGDRIRYAIAADLSEYDVAIIRAIWGGRR